MQILAGCELNVPDRQRKFRNLESREEDRGCIWDYRNSLYIEFLCLHSEVSQSGPRLRDDQNGGQIPNWRPHFIGNFVGLIHKIHDSTSDSVLKIH